MDAPADRWNEMFIPEILAMAVAGLRVDSATGLTPLVVEDVVLYDTTLEPPLATPRTWWPRYLLGSLALIGLAIYTVVTIPYNEAIRLWRGGEEIWHENPKNAQPEWVNYFRKDKLAKTLVMDSQAGTALKESKEAGEGMRDTTISFPIEYE